MKKLLLTCILLVGIIFISGCVGEEKTNSKTSTDSQTSVDSQASEPLIKPSDLPKGYYSSEYTTYAVSKGESFEIRPNFEYYYIINQDDEYEGDIPKGKKRVATSFHVTNDDSSIQMNVLIFESDSSSRLKEHISEMEELLIGTECDTETNLVGDNSILMLVAWQAVLTFTSKNYVVSIDMRTHTSEKEAIQKEIMRKEILKVAKAIESKLD